MPPAKGPPLQHSQSAPTSSAPQMNGGRLGASAQMPPPNSSSLHHFSGPNEKSQSYMPQPISNGRVPTFAQPIKPDGPPVHQPQLLPPPPTIHKSSSSINHSIGPGMMPLSVDSILKTMTSTEDLLSAIAATPRTEVIEHHRPHKYIGLPPLFSQPPCKCWCLLTRSRILTYTYHP